MFVVHHACLRGSNARAWALSNSSASSFRLFLQFQFFLKLFWSRNTMSWPICINAVTFSAWQNKLQSLCMCHLKNLMTNVHDSMHACLSSKASLEPPALSSTQTMALNCSANAMGKWPSQNTASFPLHSQLTSATCFCFHCGGNTKWLPFCHFQISWWAIAHEQKEWEQQTLTIAQHFQFCSDCSMVDHQMWVTAKRAIAHEHWEKKEQTFVSQKFHLSQAGKQKSFFFSQASFPTGKLASNKMCAEVLNNVPCGHNCHCDFPMQNDVPMKPQLNTTPTSFQSKNKLHCQFFKHWSVHCCGEC